MALPIKKVPDPCSNQYMCNRIDSCLHMHVVHRDIKLKINTKSRKPLTAVLSDVDVHSELQASAAQEVGHAAVHGQVPELHVHDLQAAGAGRHVRVAAQQDQAVRVEDRRPVLVPGVVDLVLRGGVDMARQLEVATHLDALAVLVGVRRDLEGQVAHRCVEEEERNRVE